MKWLITAIVFVSLQIFVPLASAQNSIIETVQDFRSSIVKVVATKGNQYQQGAGVIVRSNGIIVSNLHVVQSAEKIAIFSPLFGKKPATIQRIYPQYDLVLLKIPSSSSLNAVPMASRASVSLRQTVYHIGNSYLLNGTISEGRITGLGTSKQEKQRGNHDIDIIRLNLRLYQGDSGGPLFSQQGYLIGMVVAKNRHKDNVSFAIPVNKVKKILSDI